MPYPVYIAEFGNQYNTIAGFISQLVIMRKGIMTCIGQAGKISRFSRRYDSIV
ncbi:hypothetical protein [Elizabethkingia argenteiflava]|uniref:hypothetical protein n=1 Tax=Elizabethkingia argenteiflava TaxID=2681556 RepID=UPI001BB33FF4|nr:hypothetical protein [Elizabethkingia argenteiflava]